MRLVNINYVQEGDALARPVRDAAGRVLLGEGMMLSSLYLNKLRYLGFDMLFIKDEKFKDIEIFFPVSDKTKQLAYSAVSRVTSSIGADKTASNDEAKDVRKAVLEIVDDLLHSRDILNNLIEIISYDEYTYHHSVNTTILALVIAIGMGFTTNKLLELGMGVLMHDVGKTKVPNSIINSSGTLNHEEYEEIKKHTYYGYEAIKQNQDFSLLSAHVALQHHERWQGGGYPRGIKGKEIHEYSRIAAIADVYDALISKRPYREAIQPYQAYEYVVAQSGHQFDPEIVKVFMRNVAVYPTGTGVLLSNGHRGNVIRQNHYFPSRPVVRAIYFRNEPIEKPIDFDLSVHLSLMIDKVENR
ncbi:metal dependent phosphohydrolase [Syntrophobotulus glycolicus DSM 8271]|uniref:Metal dependent phosphohydrolase n=1 Tax=Syntrophobotulus glycolicus (strain DSM 8271 / FlGlyR) TaxID=645991 RepID=F0SUT5_SYNGF|nr:HD-GYP domain-containing protein [Syntrophobotulus glycolicus]ADY56651.1 metal dependent phosphohydrolase [Syntrophobotulus glycolicus DSM 8271]